MRKLLCRESGGMRSSLSPHSIEEVMKMAKSLTKAIKKAIILGIIASLLLLILN